MKSLPVFLTLLVVSLPSLAEENPVHPAPELRFLTATASAAAPLEQGQPPEAQAPAIEPTSPGEASADLPTASGAADKPVSEPPSDCSNCASSSRKSRLFDKLQTYWYTQAKPYLEDTHWGHAEYFNERPFGSYLNDTQQVQIANGTVDQMALYQYDFLEGEEELNRRGREQLKKIGFWMEQTGQPVVIEESGDTDLDKRRKEHVRAVLISMERALTDSSVVIGKPAAFGLLRGGVTGRRSEPESNFYNLLRDSETQWKTRLNPSAELP